MLARFIILKKEMSFYGTDVNLLMRKCKRVNSHTTKHYFQAKRSFKIHKFFTCISFMKG